MYGLDQFISKVLFKNIIHNICIYISYWLITLFSFSFKNEIKFFHIFYRNYFFKRWSKICGISESAKFLVFNYMKLENILYIYFKRKFCKIYTWYSSLSVCLLSITLLLCNYNTLLKFKVSVKIILILFVPY